MKTDPSTLTHPHAKSGHYLKNYYNLKTFGCGKPDLVLKDAEGKCLHFILKTNF